MKRRYTWLFTCSMLCGCASGHARTESAMAPSSTGGAPAYEASVAYDGIATTTTSTTTTTTEVYEVATTRPQTQRAAMLTASSVGDHDRRGPYLDFLTRHPHEVRAIALDTTRRQRVRVVDATGHPLRGARVAVDGRDVGTTFGDGIFDVYPGVAGLAAGDATMTITHGQTHVDVPVVVPEQGDGDEVFVRLDVAAARVPARLELAFLIDVTGSMGDELRYVNHEVAGIASRVRDGAHGVDVRLGATFYRDRGDAVPLAKIEFTQDVEGFARAMTSVEADGGGDYPEDLDAGLETVLHRLAWSDGDAVRVVVLITDAPPQSYRAQFRYRDALNEAARRGIRILPVAASGADRTVETLLRALGTCTGAPYVFLTDDSGIGAPHLEADTDRMRVEHFAHLLTRLLLADLAGIGMHEPGYGGIPDFAQ